MNGTNRDMGRSSPTSLIGWQMSAGSDLGPHHRWVDTIEVPSRAPASSKDRGSSPAIGIAAPSTHAGDDLICGVFGAIRWQSAQLEQLAHTEGQALALAQAYRANPEGFTEQLGGRYALAVLEPARGRTLLLVDRFGTTPLFYARLADESILFATSAEPLRRHSSIDSRLSAQAIFDYAFFHAVPSPETIYTGIHRLEPAQMVVLEGGKVKLSRHWTPRFNSADSASASELAAELRHRIFAAVTDVAPGETTGAFLSGGLDSSTVVGALGRALRSSPRTYSMGFGIAQFDELSYVRTVTSHFGARATEYSVQPDDVAAAIPDIARHYDQPFGNSSAVPTLLCARLAARQGIRQLLAGDGGDELFGGNQRYADQKVFERYWALPGALRRSLDLLASLGGPGRTFWPLRKIHSYVAQARMPMPDRLERYNFMSRTAPEEIFSAGFLAKVNASHPQELMRLCFHQAPTADLVDRMLYLDWKFTLADNDLPKVSVMCAAAGVSVEYPMLADSVVNFSLRLGPQSKVRGTRLRSFYKQAMQGFLPARVIRKRKHGFGLPYGEWLKIHRGLQDITHDALAGLRERGIFRPEFLDRLMEDHRAGNANFYGTFIWVLVMLELWLREHGHPRGSPIVAV